MHSNLVHISIAKIIQLDCPRNINLLLMAEFSNLIYFTEILSFSLYSYFIIHFNLAFRSILPFWSVFQKSLEQLRPAWRVFLRFSSL